MDTDKFVDKSNTLTNPYAPPEPEDANPVKLVSLPLRISSIASFLCGFVAFMAYYGYPGFMNASWYFGILPALAFLSCLLGLTALAVPWQPSTNSTISVMVIGVGIAFPLVCFGVAAALDATTKYGVFWLLPRIFLGSAASTACWIATKRIHGDTRGRRLAIIGYGLGILQCITSIIDFQYTEWAT